MHRSWSLAPTQSLLSNDPSGSLPTWVVPERICRDWTLCGGEGCEAGMISLRWESMLPEELVTPIADTSPERVSLSDGRFTSISLLSGTCLRPASDHAPCFHLGCAFVQVCDTHIYCLIQGMNNAFLLFSQIVFTPAQFCSPIHHAAAQTAILV